MKRVLMIAALTAAVSILMVGGAFAGTQEGSVFTLHAKAHTTKATTLCTTWAPTMPCSEYVTEWPVGVGSEVYLVIAKVPDAIKGIAGVSCGIQYDNALGSGIDVFGWKLCADLEFTNGAATCPPDLPPCEWPIAGGGNRITWVSTTNCQQTVIGLDGVHAIAGAFYLYAYSPDIFQLTPNLNLQIPELAVADCNASTTYLPMDGQYTGQVLFSNTALPGDGYNPCIDMIAVEPTTWGRVKTQY
jgi:hypothetical protein